MTKEELKKEAIKYAVDYHTSYGKGYKHKDLRIAYLAGAEPREKRIEELENKIADIKANCDLAIEGRDVKIKELEQENNKLLDIINNQDVKIADLEEQIKQIEKVSDYNADQLAQAKEFLNEFVQHYKNKTIYIENMQDLLEQSEQFLKGENIILEDAQAGNSPFDADEVFNKEMKAYPEEK